jgi:hypothetical protein
MIRLPIKNRSPVVGESVSIAFIRMGFCRKSLSDSHHYDLEPSRMRAFSMGRTPSDNKTPIRGCVEAKRSPGHKGNGCVSVLPQAINGLSIIDDERECLFKHYPINKAAERMMSKETHTDNQKVEL